jgi:hypothetical protein
MNWCAHISTAWIVGQVLMPHRKDVKLEAIVTSQNFLAVFHRTNGLQVR